MGSITDFLEAELLDHVCNAGYTSPTNIYLCLCTADPTDAATGGGMNEVANSGAYARKAISFGAAASRVITQDTTVTFDQATASWGTVSHWAIADSNTYGSGNVLAHGAFAASKVINIGNTPSVASGEINVTFSANEISNYLANELLDHCFDNAAYSSPATWVALCTATVGDGDTGTTISEPSGGAYARKQVDVNGGTSPTWNTATGTSPTVVDNTHAIQFAQATANWGTIVAVAICDASTTGNLLLYDNAMTDQAVNNGDTAQFPIGDLDIQMT